MMILRMISAAFVGLAGGIATGAGFVAFLTVLGIIPRLMQLSKTQSKIGYYEGAVVLGVVSFGFVELRGLEVALPYLSLCIMGILSGTFNGMLAAGLTEVLNVWPILAKRISIQEKIIYLLMALVLGKVFGSLFQWIYLVGR